MNLTSKDIRSCVDVADYSRGVEYYQKSNVLSYAVINRDATNLKLTSRVKGSGGKVYEQAIKIVLLENKFVMHGDCTCPVGYNCKHVVAASLSYVGNNLVAQRVVEKPNQDFMLNRWINSLKESAQPKSVNANEYFVTYRLFDKLSRYSTAEFSIYKSKILKNKKLSQGTKIDEYKFFSNYGYSDIKNSEDENIAMLMEGLRSNFRGTNGFFRGQLGYMALLELFKTNRCYLDTNQIPLKYLDALYEPEFSWKKTNEGYKLKSNITKEYKLLYTTPPLIIDTINSLVYRVSEDPKVLRELENCPPISEEQMLKVYETVLAIAPNIQLQTPKGIKIKIIQTKPKANVKLFYEKGAIANFNAIEVAFMYENHRIEFYPQEQKTSFLNENIKTEILRDLEFEESVKNRLEEFRFAQMREEKILIMRPFNDNNRQEELQIWSEFLELHIPQLQSEGWHVEMDESFELKFEQNSNIVVESSDTNNWFSLSFNIEIGGVSQSLVPLVSGIIAEFDDYENMPELINIEISQNNFVTLQTKQIAPILKTIFELLDKKEKDDSLKISAFDAHLIGDLDETVIWKGSREILELSQKLKNFEGIKAVVPPTCLSAKLRDYQQEGVNWLNFLYEFKFGGILADDMGLGKTIQTLTHLSRLKEDGKLTKPSLIIMPTSLIANWKNEVKKFTPNLSVLSL
ncbi:MAG: SNF2-related protein, partial [Sulfurimonas sp.]|nr:SNF2-related protein [Sulfurimonas sp.]